MNELYFIPVILVLLVLTCYFSGMETAIIYSSKAKLNNYAKGGNAQAVIALKLKKKLGLVISVILGCVCIATTIATSLTTALFISLMGDYYGTIISSTLMALVIWVCCEIMPKMVALHKAEDLLLHSSKFLYYVFLFFSPLNHVFHLFVSFVLRLFGININSGYNDTNLDELKGAIDLHQRDNQQDTLEEKAMLKSILDLGSVSVSEIMIHRKNMTMINAQDKIENIIEQALASPFTRIPLWKDTTDNIVGVIHTKELLRILNENKNNLNSIDILKASSLPWFIPENIDLLEQLKAFREKRAHLAIVVDEYGALQGIVTLEDILEEIVGEIADEHDIAVKGVRPQKDGSYIVNGNVTLRDLNRQFEWDLPNDEASTLAGLVLYEFRVIPNVGQIFSFKNFKFEILRRQKNQITLIRVIPLEKEIIT